MAMSINWEEEHCDNEKGKEFSAICADINHYAGCPGQHVRNTKQYVAMIAEYMLAKGIYPEVVDKQYAERIANAAPLHDAGSHFDPVIMESFPEIWREVHRCLVERMKAEEPRREGAWERMHSNQPKTVHRNFKEKTLQIMKDYVKLIAVDMIKK